MVQLLTLGTISLILTLLTTIVSQPAITVPANVAADSNNNKNNNNEDKDESNQNKNNNQNCIGYDTSGRTITVRCRNAITRLTDVYNKLQDRNILDKQPDGIWTLNAGIVIDKGSTFILDSNDTKWLKIIADGVNAYPISILGSLKIDSVKITSWNPHTNGYAISKGTRELNDVSGKYDVTEGFPRPYIRIEEEATGNTNITNSEIAYLGYEAGLGEGNTGLTYLGGDNSALRNNDIHDLYFAFYSKDVGGLVIENNHIHNNGHYGLDPHTRTHDMLIRNNTVHDNGSIGIICSLDCSNITIENNKAYSNARIGIMLSRNMHHSIVRNNIVYNETQGIFVSKSHNNQIYNNTVSEVKNGIYLKNMSSGNIVHDNIIKNPTSSGIQVNTGATGNTFYHNLIINPPSKDKAIVANEFKNDGGKKDDETHNGKNNQSDNNNDEIRNNQKLNIFSDNPVTI